MRTLKIKVYTVKELKKKYPDGFARALKDHCEEVERCGIHWNDEVMDSLKGLFKAAGIKLTDWKIGAYSYSHVKFDMGDAAELDGRRAWAWLENNLFSALRVPYRGPARWDVAKYGEHYRPGMIKPCPFTGVCFDDDFLDQLRANVRAGMNLEDAFSDMADVARRIMEKEYEAEQSEEYFIDEAEANEYEFKASGERV